MHLMRSLFFIVAHYQISSRACHVPVMPSRGITSLFFSLLQAADSTPTHLPELLMALLVSPTGCRPAPSYSRVDFSVCGSFFLENIHSWPKSLCSFLQSLLYFTLPYIGREIVPLCRLFVPRGAIRWYG